MLLGEACSLRIFYYVSVVAGMWGSEDSLCRGLFKLPNVFSKAHMYSQAWVFSPNILGWLPVGICGSYCLSVGAEGLA